MDLDQGGFGFQRVRTYLGPSLGWKDELVQPSSHITIGGIYSVQPGESLLLVDVAAPVEIKLPDVTKWIRQTADQPATAFDRSITVKDVGGNATNFNIVITPFGQQAIDEVQQSIIITIARGAVRLVPLIDMSGWIIASITTAGGGGGGGDVFKAGNNTYTGANTFTNTTIALTEPTIENSTKVATTAFVKAQGYIISSALASYAPLANPVFTGDPQAPTPSPGDNDTSIATTAFVQTAVNTKQPLDADLTSIAGQTTNNVFYYRVADGNWQPVVVSTGLAFSGGNLTATASGGNVSNVGTPTAGQVATWTDATHIQGVAPSSLGFQPLDGDLTAIAALTGTNTIYYRSGVDTWSPVTYSGLTFSGGILTVSAGGGNVISVGTPTSGQIASWTDATHIQGVSLATAGIQPLDATLTALAAYNTNGLLTQTAADTFAGRTLTGPAAGITVTNGNGVAGNPTLALANDLAALEALAGTNNIYYRSGIDAWSSVTFSGLTFSGGILTVTAGGGNVSNTGTPAATQWVQWTDATHIQGVAVGNWKLPYTDGSAAIQSVALGAAGTALVSTGAAAAPTAQAVLQPGVAATTTVGYKFTSYNLGTISSGTVTPDAANGNYQYYTNNGAHTMGAPAADCAIDILVTNGATAGAISFPSYLYAVGNNGDPLTTTNGYRFILSIRRIAGTSTVTVKALQ